VAPAAGVAVVAEAARARLCGSARYLAERLQGGRAVGGGQLPAVWTPWRLQGGASCDESLSCSRGCASRGVQDSVVPG